MNKSGFILCFATVILFTFKVHALPNPWTDCGDDVSCGAEIAGFNFLPKVENYTVRAMKGMIEFRFFLDDKRSVILRKSETPTGEPDENGIIDISGDYNTYPVNKTITLENGVKFSVKGKENSYKVVNFAAESGYYSIICD